MEPKNGTRKDPKFPASGAGLILHPYDKLKPINIRETPETAPTLKKIAVSQCILTAGRDRDPPRAAEEGQVLPEEHRVAV